MKNLLMNILAFATLLSAVLIITSKNPVICIVFLILTFVNAAIYLILSGIGFIGAFLMQEIICVPKTIKLRRHPKAYGTDYSRKTIRA